MPPSRQRKFELIPTTLVKSNGQRPPMTSKAAKKAYQKANQGPKVSRAEQRRLDQEELERHRKEYEKERATEKARAAREKKALKVEAERSKRKKLGIPEPSRFVRASQPTISRFVKGNGKRVWQEVDGGAEDSDGTVCDDDQRHGLECPVKQNITEVIQNLRGFSPTTKSLTKSEEGSHSASESEDGFADLSPLSPPQLLDKMYGSSHLLEEGSISSSPTPESREEHPHSKRSSQLPKNRVARDDLITDSQELAEAANTQLLSEAVEVEPHSGHAEPSVACPDAHQEMDQALQSTNELEIQASNDRSGEDTYKRQKVLSPRALRNRSINMPPPPLRHGTQRKPILDASKPAPAQIVSQNSGKRLPKLVDLPPPSTQEFLENNLDEFLPSPSQELRELLSDGEDLPPNNDILADFSPAKLEDERRTGVFDDSFEFDTLICTQDLILSSQDLQEISPNPNKDKTRRPSPRAINIPRGPAIESYWGCLPSTQDLALSAQDLEEIETPSRAPRSTSKNLQSETRRLLSETTGVLTTKKLLNDSKASSAQILNQTSCARRPLEEQVNHQLKGHSRQKRRFFEEKEEDLYQAALHESRLMALKPMQKQAQKVPLKGEGTIDFGVETERKREKRTLQRSQSAATDYGDDEFEGFSEHDLAALC